MNPVSRFVKTLVSPTEVMAELKDKPVWIAPLVTVALISCISGLILATAFDYDAMLKAARDQQLERLPLEQKRRLDNMSDSDREQMEKMMEWGTTLAKVATVAGPLIAVPLMVLLISGVLYLLAHLQGADTTFKAVFSMVAHAQYVVVVASVVTVILVGLTGRLDQILSAALVLSKDSAGGLAFHVWNRFSIFGIWLIVLNVIGMEQVAGLSRTKAVVTVVGPWLLWSVLVVALSMLGTGL